MKKGRKKGGIENRGRREEPQLLIRDRDTPHTSPWTVYLTDVKEIFLFLIVVWPKAN